MTCPIECLVKVVDHIRAQFDGTQRDELLSQVNAIIIAVKPTIAPRHIVGEMRK